MRIIILIFLSFISTLNCFAQNQLESDLQNFPLANYLNKPIDSLIAHLPTGYDTLFVVGSAGNINKGASIQINYANYQFWLDIFITSPQFITVQRDARYSSVDTAWPLQLLRKEKVGRVTIFKGDYLVINDASVN